MDSDGTPWRPFVHILDISQAIACVLRRAARRRPRPDLQRRQQRAELPGPRDRRDHRARRSRVAATEFGDSSGDNRNYRANFDKIHEHLPASRRGTTSPRGAQQLLDVFRAVEMTTELFEFRGHTRIKQIQHLLATDQIDDRFFWRSPAPPAANRMRVAQRRVIGCSPPALRRLLPDRLDPDRRRARLLRPDLGRRVVRASSGSTMRNVQTNCRTTASAGTIRGLHWQVDAVRRVEAPALHARRGLRRRGRPPARLADLRAVAGRTSSTPSRARSSSSRRAARTAIRRSRTTAEVSLPGLARLRPRRRARHPLGRPRLRHRLADHATTSSSPTRTRPGRTSTSRCGA